MTDRRLADAELLAIGTELTAGITRDTNGGDLAAELTALGVRVVRLSALPDDLVAVTGAVTAALARADLLVTSGGLGPTPDDLTREAIAAACGETPAVDPQLERWLRDLFGRRGMAMAASNRKQAWLIPSARPLANLHGTAPGWWVDRPDGRVIVALPGPPREMRPMWREQVLPRLRERGLGLDRAAATLRLTGIGESALADLIGEPVLRRANPEVATYARDDAVDVRVSAVAEGGRSAAELVAETVAALEPLLAEHLFARGEQTWPDVLGRQLAGRRLAVVEVGTGGRLQALLGDAPWLAFGELVAPGSPPDTAHPKLAELAERVRTVGGAEVGLAVRARDEGGDMTVTVAVALPEGVTEVTRTAFLGGDQGRRRAALLACGELWRRLGEPAPA